MLNSILSSLRLKHVLTELPSDIPLAKESMRHCRQRVIATPFTSTLTRQVWLATLRVWLDRLIGPLLKSECAHKVIVCVTVYALKVEYAHSSLLCAHFSQLFTYNLLLFPPAHTYLFSTVCITLLPTGALETHLYTVTLWWDGLQNYRPNNRLRFRCHAYLNQFILCHVYLNQFIPMQREFKSMYSEAKCT